MSHPDTLQITTRGLQDAVPHQSPVPGSGTAEIIEEATLLCNTCTERASPPLSTDEASLPSNTDEANPQSTTGEGAWYMLNEGFMKDS